MRTQFQDIAKSPVPPTPQEISSAEAVEELTDSLLNHMHTEESARKQEHARYMRYCRAFSMAVSQTCPSTKI